ncbi:hypothetical protein FRB99_001546, partial [Tulasnella sp. 403]
CLIPTSTRFNLTFPHGWRNQRNRQSKAVQNNGRPTSKSSPKEKVFHPQSRKAAQLERAHLRKNKLGDAKTKRSRIQVEKIDRFVFFQHALPSDVESLSLSEVHEIIQDIWLHRHDKQLAEEQGRRRKGEPRSAKEDKILAQIEMEKEEYRTGLEIPDLTDPPTVEVLRKWEDGDPNYLPLLRLVMVYSDDPDKATLTRPGEMIRNLQKNQKKKLGGTTDAMVVD